MPSSSSSSSNSPHWTRRWHKFLIERLGIDSLQFGLLLLFLLSLISLLLLIMPVFLRSFCFPNFWRRRRKNTTVTVLRRASSNTVIGTNEERRCLLQPNGIGADRKEPKIRTEENANERKDIVTETMDSKGRNEGVGTVREERANCAESQQKVVPSSSRHHPHSYHSSPPITAPRSHHHHHPHPHHRFARCSAEQSPPPPRRFASGGRTQVLPLTGHNRRRVPPLVMLMADQQQQLQCPPPHLGTPDSRATTTTMTTTTGATICATIPEDPEETMRAMSDELLSIDRTFVSVADPPPPICSAYRVNRCALRASPSPHHPPPKFEIAPPSYSPPAPPIRNDCEKESRNLSSPDRSSYGGQTPLNTTTGSSAESIDAANRNVGIRISELESETGDLVMPTVSVELLNGLTDELANAIGRRVPRSISQQLELMNMTTATTKPP